MKLAQRFAISLARAKFKFLSVLSKKKAAAYAFRLFCTPRLSTSKPLPAGFESAEILPSVFGEYQITGYRWNKGAGQKALLLHGFESKASNFGHFVRPLVAKGYEVLAFDAPAHGQSSGSQVNALIYKEFIQFVEKEYGPVRSFIGHSFGGLALSLALAEIKHDESSRVVLIAPATETSTAIEHLYRLIGNVDAGVRQAFEKIIFDIGGHPISWYSVRRTLPNISAKILWIHDEDDDITPIKDVDPIRKENHPNIEFVITQGLGHRRIYRDAEVGKTIVDFI